MEKYSLTVFEQEVKGHRWLTKDATTNLVIATGMTEGSYRYDDFAKYLNANGINVFCLDHYGQGRNISHNGKGLWPHDGFNKCINNIHLNILHAKENGLPTILMGHSMGSFMVRGLIEKYPDEVEKVIFMGTGFQPQSLLFIGKTIASLITSKNNQDTKSMLLHNLSVGSYSKKVKRAKTEFDWLSHDEKQVLKYIENEQCGFVPSRGFYKWFFKGLYEINKPAKMRLISKKMSILLVSGDEDPVGNNGKGPTKLSLILKDKYRIDDVKNIVYKGMRHEILNEVNKLFVYKDILNFIIK